MSAYKFSRRFRTFILTRRDAMVAFKYSELKLELISILRFQNICFYCLFLQIIFVARHKGQFGEKFKNTTQCN